MDFNRNEGGGHPDFAPFPPSFPTPPSRPSHSVGLSRPRLVKERRHQASSRAKPPPVPYAGAGDGFDPSNTAIPFPPDRAASDGGSQVLGDRMDSWNPFASKPSASRVSESPDSGSVLNSTFGYPSKGSEDSDGSFVFGSDSKKSTFNMGKSRSKNPSSPNLGSFGYAKSRSGGYDFGNNTMLFSNDKFVGSASKMSSTFSSSVEGVQNPDADVFSFGNAMKNGSKYSSFGSDEGSFSRLPNEMGKLKLHSTSNEDGLSSIFGGRANAQSESSGKPEVDVFVFGGGIESSSTVRRSSSLGSDEGPLSHLPDEMRKLKLQNTGNKDSFGKPKQADYKPMFEEEKYIFHGSDNAPGLASDNSDANVFVFGGGTTNSSNLSRNSSIGSDYITLSQLPNEMKNLKLKQATPSSKVDKTDNFVFVGSTDEQNSYGGTANKLLDEMEKLNFGREETFKDKERVDVDFGAGTFVFGSSLKASFVSGQVPSSNFNNLKKNMNSEFRDDMRKATSDGFRNDDNLKDTKDADCLRKMDPSASFVFGSSNSKFGISTLPDDLNNLNISSKTEKTVGGSEPVASVEPASFNFTFEAGKQETFCFSKENFFSGPYQNKAFTVKKGEVKGTKTRKRAGRPKQSAAVAKDFIFTGKVSEEAEPSGDYSPMDCSPYRESVVADRHPSCSSEDSVDHIDPHISAPLEDELVFETQRSGIGHDNLNHGKLDEVSEDHMKRNFNSEFPYVDVQAEISTDSNIEEVSDHGSLFTFSSAVEERGESSLPFAASSSVEGSSSVPKRRFRRKSRMNTSQDSMPSTSVPFASLSSESIPVARSSFTLGPKESLNRIIPQTEKDKREDDVKKPEASQEAVQTVAASIAAKETCEKWRLRGNQAYANGHPSKAEDYYTRGVNSIPHNETLASCILALKLCYSNRAATRMSLGRMREAIYDCRMAIEIDPDFLRAQVRAANCHLALGEVDDALKYFTKCLQTKHNANPDQKILIEASEGRKKAQRVADCMEQSSEFLRKKTTNDAAKALQVISEALSISPHSENLKEIKAEALLMLHCYEETIQLCEQTLELADKNSTIIGADGQLNDLNSSPERFWRWHLMAKSYFYLGKLEEALELLHKHEKLKPIEDKFRNRSAKSSQPLSVTIHELLRLKAAGNETFQAGRHLEAVEHYSAALACNMESRPFAAICFCNRAAAYQALGQITEAIADCTLAVAFDASYPKAISRRATLHEMIRDYGQAANDLNRLINLLEKKLKDRNNISETLARSTSYSYDLKQARLRLSTVEEESRKEIPLDMYMILGIEPSSSAADVKKAYRKSALRHHPDKAGHFLARNEIVDELWREIADEVHMEAERLFKMIGEAYTVLLDPTKRLQYDAEEEMRATTKKGNNVSSKPRTAEDVYNGFYEKNVNRRRDYGSSNHRYSEYYSRSDR